jgi:hypothetical protein
MTTPPFQLFTSLLAALLFLDFLAFQALWKVWFAVRLKPWWLLALVCLASPWAYTKLAGSLFLLLVFRHYFIEQRWVRVRRGGGAPGFMSHWAMLHLVTIQMGAFLDPSGYLAGKALWVARVDLAVIMICAGFYKYCVGYLHHDGMEYGRVNPFWGYHWRFFRHKSPDGFYPRLMNRLACLVEIVGGLMMLIPGPWQFYGAVMISISFIYVSLFIRLGRLAWLMALLPMLFHPQLGLSLQIGAQPSLAAPPALITFLAALANLYVVLLPLVKLTQYSNLFWNWRWPGPIQKALDRYANFVPIIMWRVFTPDVTNFYVRIFTPDGQAVVNEETYSLKNWSKPVFKLRMLHVCESIALTSVFTTLRYFPSKPELFAQRLREYARSLGDYPALRFEVVAILKENGRFRFQAVESVSLDPEGRVERTALDSKYRFEEPSRYSPVREASKPGSYVAASKD